MNKITDSKKIFRTSFLFMMVYFISYITRINYGAVISEIVVSEGITKAMASLAVTGSFITYGIGQLISGFFGDRIQPKHLILIGFITTVCMNLLITVCKTPYQMAAVWCVNGLAQAFMWPPLVKLMTYLFDEITYKRTCMVVSWGSSFGTIAVYMLAPLCIKFSEWRTIFLISASCAFVMIFIWLKTCPIIELKPVRNTGNAENITEKQSFPWSLMIFAIMLAIILQGSLRDGVTTWMPSLISDTFNLSNSVSILTGVILPIFGIFSYQIALMIYQKKFKNELMCGGVIFLIGAISALILWMFNGSNPIVTVAFIALLSASMHGVNLILVCMVPAYFSKYGCVSFATGLFNSCTYVGSAISTYGMALFSDKFGWDSTIFLWFAIAIAGTAVCLIFKGKWSKFIN